jgi:serine/threonine-protein kinase
MLKAGTILGNRYEVIEKIGAGGMSIVYRARDTKLGRYVTVKVLRDEFIADEEFVSRFKIEAQAAASLSHPNIVNVYDVGTEYDTQYIVMEYIHGVTLKEIITKEAPFDTKKALNYSLKIASALQHAHKNHIIHRDIKPQNILVMEDGELKVTDFGIAHAATSSTVTMTSTAIGSVHYFSPEQARGGYVDEKSDLYSLGIVMYEMVTGKLPFEGDSSVSIALKHINEDLPSISDINPSISKSIEKIILKATQKRVDQRYADMDTMILDMKKALNDPTGSFIQSADTALSSTQKISDEDLKLIRDESRKEGVDKLYDEDEDNEYEKDDLDKTEEIKVIVAAVATAFAVIAIICVVWFAITNHKAKTASTQIPNLVGKSVEDATTLLKGMNLTITIGNKVESDKYAVGLIVNQSPQEGTKLEGQTSVVVDISAGNQLYEVPSVANTEMKKAIEKIEKDQKFTADYKYSYSDDVAVGVVISQEPKAGEKAKFGTKIVLNISKGPEVKNISVPNIVGLSEAAAKAKIEGNGLVVGTITYSESDTVEKGLVIKQLVAANKQATSNDIVGFVVSSGKSDAKPVETQVEATKKTQETTQAATAAPAKTTTKSFTIAKPTVEAGKTQVTVKMIKITNDSIKTVYEKQHNISEFPINVSVSGEGSAEIQLYIDKALEWQKPVNFSE